MHSIISLNSEIFALICEAIVYPLELPSIPYHFYRYLIGFFVLHLPAIILF